ncbi:alpha/beta hydrolase [Paenibacillus sp. JCM 10914]|uniref:alpha/beta hydrolase n=1 Tax=Paenibacillus sp. JCM 10914 TaxID=1236974 RepID=UPI0003CC9580|nr:alpha/beta hydrolase [Paenibacillus sp. JCM 10914]GAE04111.1 esterase/lipase-like protein [Paenibacillus sp. JCM 10914]
MKLWEGNTPGYESVDDKFEPYMTPYILNHDEPGSAVLVLPGGGYVGRAEHEGEPIALWLNSVGVSAFVVQYRVNPYQHPYPLMDAQRAIRLVRHHAEEWNLDQERVGILGFSAGGHLAATASTHFDDGDLEAEDPVERQSSRPNASILCYPVISFGQFGHVGSLHNLLGEPPEAELKQALSLEFAVKPLTPPTFLWHTADDAAVPVENSFLYASALRKLQIPFELHVFPTGRHGLGLAEEDSVVAKWTELCEIWLSGIGFRTVTKG